ncbi:isochorismate synthase [Nakamurella lactea]|uniref:isochorismate synthase n=1 Tax=Nakamurella lactea TaxID=459515 RepID=UPI0004186862|nr:isochorismate synthase [Nakamurella lactea]
MHPTTAALDSAVRVVTRAIEPIDGSLFTAIPAPTGTLSFVTDGDGLIGWGEYARFTTAGPGAARQIGDWFAELVDQFDIDDADGIGGPVAFVALGFDSSGPTPDEAVAIVPQVLIRRNGRGTFSTVIGRPDRQQVVPVRSPGSVRYSDATFSVAGFTAAVAAATARIRAGELRKVVLSHDLTATTERDVDERFLLDALAARYPSCWTYAIDGLIGATPEMLLQRNGSHIQSRVLAGTGWAEHAGDPVSATLIASSKNQEEHRYAVDSVAEALLPVSTTLEVPAQASPLVLANLTHLATDISGELTEPALTALELAALLHPTAAVGGTPTHVAMQTIRELEPVGRGRYAGPVGWIDASGDGEFALALRCAEVRGRTVRMIAGGGIVADSDPDTEAREAQVKMLPIRDALESG